ncbi:hypothetical protein [Pseudomonas sp. 5P_5.1_Bac1]|uniref:hypothetical protein n=1 Tax=Pseudomonas sp. 5P_5.1_Bac1 TaxID=2971616 RepID=UPI0021C768C3|nr:hypothetical protein [Pseudomonas sp. 5P_5.1_Bac1]MCU1724478.1 hypothetical protein [Pseudomonas sp. 5P_5.1_Bac1]
MNLIKNGNFELGTEPWTTMEGHPLTFEIISWNNKKWLLTNGLDGPQNGNLQQIIPNSDELSGIHFRLTITAKAVPTGGTMQSGVQSDNDANRLIGEVIAYPFLYPLLPDTPNQAGSIRVSVKEQTYTHRFTINHLPPTTHGKLAIVNWGLGDTDKANILITDIKFEAVDPAVDPEEPAENVSVIDLSSLGLPAVNVSPMKVIK